MSLLDLLGLIGVGLILVAYAGIHVDRLDPKRAPALLMNLAGSLLIIASMTRGAFNLSAFIMEAAWAAVALLGLARLLRRMRSRSAQKGDAKLS